MSLPNILILETNEPRRRQITDALTALGTFQVLQASSAEIALALLRSWPAAGIGVCGMANGHLEALALGEHEGRLGALILLGDSIELHRQARRLSQVGKLPILGCIDLPVCMSELSEMISRYTQQQRHRHRVLPTYYELHSALVSGQFQARFQPILKLPSKQPCAVELVAVWCSPKNGDISASEFLPAMVAYDLIDALFDAMLDQGLEWLVSLEPCLRNMRLILNVQASQLNAEHFIERILSKLRKYSVSPGRLIIEIGENGLLALPSSSLEKLNQLRMLGCGLGVDQFGSGFSSLPLLCQQHFQYLKLAPNLICELDTPSGYALLVCTLALAGALNMQVVVSGVRKRMQHETLLKAGCPRVQGAHYASAMHANDLRDWLGVY